MQPLLSIEDLSIDFISGEEQVKAVKNISFHVNKGEILALVGESGSGKSVTALSLLQLLPKPPAIYTGGRILFNDNGTQTDLLKATASQISSIRGNRIAMIFQEPMTSLNPVMTCGSQVQEALLLHKKISAAEARKQTISWMEKVKLPEPHKIINRYPHQLSGGQKQRVMIAMAMCTNPSLLICDEPTTALDVTVQKTILDLIRELQQEQQMGVLFITHDLGVVATIADRVAIMYRGEILEESGVQIVFKNPTHPYTKALIACRPAGHEKGKRLPTVQDFMDPDSRIIESTPGIQPENLTTTHPILEVKNLSVHFPVKYSILGKPQDFYKAVDEVSFQINKGETLGLVGESGCGKTTLGRTLLRLIDPTSGSILLHGKDITKLTGKDLHTLRKEVQLVFQDPYSSLNPRLTIGAAIEEPMKVAGINRDAAGRKKRVAELLEQVRLSPSMMQRYPHEFSGGQRQRIVIARSLGLNPSFLVCDESVSALDVSVQAQVLNLLNELKRELGLTMLFISHDLSVVRYMCDRILVMEKGKIVESGIAEDVYRHPSNPYTKKLIEAIPTI